MKQPKAEFKIKIIREADDFAVLGAEIQRVIRISLGGNDKVGYYCVFRGEPSEAIRLLEQAAIALAASFGFPRKDEHRSD